MQSGGMNWTQRGINMKQSHQVISYENLVKTLEAERNDISYRKPLAAPQVQVIVKEVKRVPEHLKKVYFHAGRYAAGDRDTLATEANEKFEKIEQ
jgi:hypothetical protein